MHLLKIRLKSGGLLASHKLKIQHTNQNKINLIFSPRPKRQKKIRIRNDHVKQPLIIISVTYHVNL